VTAGDRRQNRSDERVEHHLIVEVDHEGTRFTATSRNLSLGGMFLEAKAPLKVGARLHLRFVVPTQREPIESDAEVRWLEAGGFGLRFIGLRARDVWALGKLLTQIAARQD
jgi:uncharacterized protein (TIGR02266 family)